ncbi:MAG TPA: hypothetical protein VGY77_06555 [Gemmataceae bacterium]|jgi:hypothetical protein|nr:hypothetical protein [Gemmataceae bacterium]
MKKCRFIPWRVPGLAVIGLPLLVVIGCGGKKLYPVEGKVVFPDGTPMIGGWVEFEPMDGKANVSAKGQIQKDGTFRLGTNREGDGAIEGRHRILIVPPLPPRLEERGALKPLIAQRFQRFETSGLEFTVTPGKNFCPIKVEKP